MENSRPQEPIHPEKRKRGRGCKIAVIILGVLLVIVIVAGYLICTNVHKLAGMALKQVEEDMVKNLPDECDEAVVRDTFGDARRALDEKRINVEEAGYLIQRIAKSHQDAMEDGELTAEEVDGILDQVRTLSVPSDKQ